MQENTIKNSADSCRNYYEGLTKTEKSKLLIYLNKKFQLPASTMQAKFKGYNNYNFSTIEVKVIADEIRSGKWRNS